MNQLNKEALSPLAAMFRKRCKCSGWYELQVWDIQDFLRVMAPLQVFLQTVQDALQPPGCSRDTDYDSVSEEIQQRDNFYHENSTLTCGKIRTCKAFINIEY